MSEFKVGDRVVTNRPTIDPNNCGFLEEMESLCGKVGKVTIVYENGDIAVQHDGQFIDWDWPASACTLANDPQPDTTFDRLAAVAQEAVAKCRAAIARAEAAEADRDSFKASYEEWYESFAKKLTAVTAERDALKEKFTGGHIAGLEDSLAHHRYAVERLTAERDGDNAHEDKPESLYDALRADDFNNQG